MNIMLDVDGVLADMELKFRKTLATQFDVVVPDGEPQAWGWTSWINAVTQEMENDVWSIINETPDWWLHIEPYQQALNQQMRLRHLSERHLITYVTSRPAIAYDITRIWLANYHFPQADNVFIATNQSKADVMRSLGCHVGIDDYGPNVTQMLDRPGIAGVLLRRPYNESFVELVKAKGGTVVDQLSEYIDLIMQAEVRAEEQQEVQGW